MSTPHETVAQQRARSDLPEALRAAAKARDTWWKERQSDLSCASCGAHITNRPTEGQGLPCGH